MAEFHHCPTCSQPLNYEPNTIRWQPGGLVLHDADAKQGDMIMVVVEVVDEHTVLTRYARDAMYNGVPLLRGDLKQNLCNLHDPTRFGVNWRDVQIDWTLSKVAKRLKKALEKAKVSAT